MDIGLGADEAQAGPVRRPGRASSTRRTIAISPPGNGDRIGQRRARRTGRRRPPPGRRGGGRRPRTRPVASGETGIRSARGRSADCRRIRESSRPGTIPLPAASSSAVKKPAQPSRIVISGSPATVASNSKRKRIVVPWRKNSRDADVVPDHVADDGQPAVERDVRVEQPVDRLAPRQEVDAQVAGEDQVGLARLHRDAGGDPVAVQVPGIRADDVLGDDPAAPRASAACPRGPGSGRRTSAARPAAGRGSASGPPRRTRGRTRRRPSRWRAPGTAGDRRARDGRGFDGSPSSASVELRDGPARFEELELVGQVTADQVGRALGDPQEGAMSLRARPVPRRGARRRRAIGTAGCPSDEPAEDIDRDSLRCVHGRDHRRCGGLGREGRGGTRNSASPTSTRIVGLRSAPATGGVVRSSSPYSIARSTGTPWTISRPGLRAPRRTGRGRAGRPSRRRAGDRRGCGRSAGCRSSRADLDEQADAVGVGVLDRPGKSIGCEACAAIASAADRRSTRIGAPETPL